MIEFPKQDIPGRVALVIGGTRGIGKAIARGLGQAGVTVVIAARNAEIGEKAALEVGAIFRAVDMSDSASIAGLAMFVEERFGKLDILVNDAAAAFPPISAFEVTPAQMRQVYEVNVFAIVDAIQKFRPLLEKSEAGRIVNVSSERGTLSSRDQSFGTLPNMAYSSSKTALNAITQHFAHSLEQAGSKIKVNAAAPGHCATEFNNFRGKRTPEQGAYVAIELALMDGSGPNGCFFNDLGAAPW